MINLGGEGEQGVVDKSSDTGKYEPLNHLSIYYPYVIPDLSISYPVDNGIYQQVIHILGITYVNPVKWALMNSQNDNFFVDFVEMAATRYSLHEFLPYIYSGKKVFLWKSC